ncbi:MAG: SRPBCC family protein [Pararhodobacter sp.]|nr:SRPBCC family protein [Pararhodobacter sp.]
MPRVFESAIIPAPVAQIWHLVRDFDSLPHWAPFVRHSRIEDGARSDQVGCVRVLELADGGAIRERLLALSDYDFSLSYAILDSPMPLDDYVATLALAPVTDRAQTFCSWQATFDCPPDTETRLTDQIGRAVFAAGLRGLADRFRDR